jgi:hypothetical protein
LRFFLNHRRFMRSQVAGRVGKSPRELTIPLPAQIRRIRRSKTAPAVASNQYRHLARLEVRYATWDLTQVHLVDERLGKVLCRLFPQDKTANANGLRRSLEPVSAEPAAAPASGMAPLLARLIERQAATGLPPAYLVKEEGTQE